MSAHAEREPGPEREPEREPERQQEAAPPFDIAPDDEEVARFLHHYLLALVAIIEGRARGRERDELFTLGVNPRNTPGGRRSGVENWTKGKYRPAFVLAWKRLTHAQQRTLTEDGVFDERPFVHYDPGRVRWRAVPFGYRDANNGDFFVLPEETAEYVAARRAGRPFVSRYPQPEDPGAGGTATFGAAPAKPRGKRSKRA